MSEKPSSDQQRHYFDTAPKSTSAPRTIRLDLVDLSLQLETDNNVFSPDRVDPGTKMLLSDRDPALDHPSNGPCPILVDLGAGYGPIGLTLAKRNPSATIYLVEVNQRASDLVRRNAATNGCHNVVVCDPTQWDHQHQIDQLWSNPPIRIGKKELRTLMSMWLERLAPTGFARLVINKNLGGDSLSTWMSEQGYEVVRTGSKQGYRLLTVRPT